MAVHITLVAMFIRAVAMLTTTAIRASNKNVGIPKRKSPLMVQMGTDSRHTSERGLHQAEYVRLAMNSNAQTTAIASAPLIGIRIASNLLKRGDGFRRSAPRALTFAQLRDRHAVKNHKGATQWRRLR